MRKLLLAAAFLMLAGCSPAAREPSGLALARVLGVDGISPVTLTAVCAGEDGLRGACTGESFEQVRDRLPWAGEEKIALTSVGWLVVGQESDLTAVLFAVLEDRELAPSAGVWLAERSAAELLAACEDPAAELELLKEQGVHAPTAAHALGTLATEGSVVLPVLTQEEGRLTVRGEARWTEQR